MLSEDGVVLARPAGHGVDLAINELISKRLPGLPIEVAVPGLGLATLRYRHAWFSVETRQ